METRGWVIVKENCFSKFLPETLSERGEMKMPCRKGLTVKKTLSPCTKELEIENNSEGSETIALETAGAV